jgi:Zn finger protein HypA/HybF involved in hydrogenase expression
MKKPQKVRFRDTSFAYWNEPALVVCPRCSGPAHAHLGAVACTNCGFSRSQTEGKFNPHPVALVHVAWNPRCVVCGFSLPKVARATANSSSKEVRVKCPNCQAVRSYLVRPQHRMVDDNCDPETGLPYYLATPFGANILWLRNLEHLTVLGSSVKLRIGIPRRRII